MPRNNSIAWVLEVSFLRENAQDYYKQGIEWKGLHRHPTLREREVGYRPMHMASEHETPYLLLGKKRN
jgi:hypothetical protein